MVHTSLSEGTSTVRSTLRKGKTDEIPLKHLRWNELPCDEDDSRTNLDDLSPHSTLKYNDDCYTTKREPL